MVQKGNHERVVMSVSSESSGIDAVMVYVVGIREALSRVRTNGRLSNHGLAQVLHCASLLSKIGFQMSKAISY
jgi:hypothetical protein